MKQRHYTLTTTWKIDASANTVWQALTASPFSWPRWWPELQVVDALIETPKLVGSKYRCIWRAKAYKLHSDVEIVSARPRQSIVLRAFGDLDGTAECELIGRNGQTEIFIRWHVTTTKPWMNFLAPLLSPVFIANHRIVMRSGERGLNRYLTDSK